MAFFYFLEIARFILLIGQLPTLKSNGLIKEKIGMTRKNLFLHSPFVSYSPTHYSLELTRNSYQNDRPFRFVLPISSPVDTL